MDGHAQVVLSRLNRYSQVGDHVFWTNLKGERFEGRLIEWDSNVAIVKVEDGSFKYVET